VVTRSANWGGARLNGLWRTVHLPLGADTNETSTFPAYGMFVRPAIEFPPIAGKGGNEAAGVAPTTVGGPQPGERAGHRTCGLHDRYSWVTLRRPSARPVLPMLALSAGAAIGEPMRSGPTGAFTQP
jgi:hypothetical protein